MNEQRDTVQAAKDFITAALAKNFNLKIDDESARTAAEKIVRGLPVSAESAAPKRAA